jgi:hypothetical protein
MDADTQLREMADMRVKLAAIEDRVKLGSLDLDGGIEKAAVAGLGGVMMLVGGLGLARRRRAANPPERSGPDTD